MLAILQIIFGLLNTMLSLIMFRGVVIVFVLLRSLMVFHLSLVLFSLFAMYVFLLCAIYLFSVAFAFLYLSQSSLFFYRFALSYNLRSLRCL